MATAANTDLEPGDLQDHLAAHQPAGEGKLGARVGGANPNMPMLHRFADPAADIQVPLTCLRSYEGFNYGMLLNDRLGDCVIAEVYHAVMHALNGVRKPVPDPTELEPLVESVYSLITGYTPGDPSTDQGTNPADAYGFWRDQGLPMPDGSADRSIGSMQVLPHDGVNLRRGIYEFDCVGLSIAMPQAWQGAESWTLGGDQFTDSAWQPGSWGGHQVLGVSYDQDWISVITWGGVKLMSWQAWGVYGSLGLVQVNQDLISAGGVTETGIDLDRLGHDLPLL